MLHGTLPHPVQCGLAKPEQHHQMLALAGRVRTKASFRPPEEVSQPGRRRRDGAQELEFTFGCSKVLQPCGGPPSGRRDRARAGIRTVRPVRGSSAGSGRQPEIGLNKPANLSARARG